MNTDSIELICQKLGTTLENLVPAVIDYNIYADKIGIFIGAVILIIGFILIGVAIYLNHKEDYYDEPIVLYFLILMAIAVGSIIFFVSIVDYHYFVKFPEIRAYKAILGWIR